METKSLRMNAIELMGAVTLGIVMLSPAMTIYGNFGSSFLSAGKAAPLIFVWALLATLPTAMSYALLSREFPSAGSVSTWTAQTGFTRIARWASWMVFFYYLTNFAIQPIAMGVFLNDVLNTLGFGSSVMTYVGGALLCCVVSGWIAYRGVSVSVKGAFSFLLFETLIVMALCATVGWIAPQKGASLSLEGFHVSASPTGMSGLFQALVFGMLSFCGFDVISTLGEETKMPKKLIPQATFISLLIFGTLMVLGVWVLTYAAPTEKLKAIADAGGMPISEIARLYWGKGAILVPLTAISAALGIAIATSIGASRVLFSMGRRGDASALMGKLHDQYQVPWNAMHVIFGIGILAALVTVCFLGPYQTWVWWCTTSTFFAMLTYLAVNLANLILFRHRIFLNSKSFILHGLIPALGIVLDGYILVQSFFIELWKQGWNTGKSVICFDLFCAMIGLGFAFKKR